MKPKLVALGLASFLLTTILLSAGEPWKEKPYTEWTAKEVARMLDESPWAHSVLMQGNFVVSPEDAPTATGFGGPRVMVRWQSALTVRQALVRQAELQGNLDREAANRFLAATPPAYVVVVSGPILTTFRYLTEEVVAESSHLEIRGRKHKIRPLGVRMTRQGRSVVAIELHFPRQAGDQPVIDPQDRKVNFYFGVSTGWALADFDLSKMVRDGKPDL